MSAVAGGKLRVYRSTESLGRWLRRLLIFSMSYGAVQGVLQLKSAADLRRLAQSTHNLPIGLIPPIAPAWFVLIGEVGIATTVVWLVWQHRSQADLFATGCQGLGFTPDWAVGWWFVPFANFVMPYRTMSELWRRSGAAEAEGSGSGRLLGVWWGVYAGVIATLLIAEMVLLFTGTRFGGVITRQVSSVADERLLGAVGASLQVVAGALALRIVAAIDRAVTALGDRTVSASMPPGPGLAPPRPDLGAPPR